VTLVTSTSVALLIFIFTVETQHLQGNYGIKRPETVSEGKLVIRRTAELLLILNRKKEQRRHF
jgi:hypothetical protein